MDSQYRIKWGRVWRGERRVRMCIAERKTWLGIWWPCGDWEFSEADAEQNIAQDRALRSPLPQPRMMP